MDASTKVEPTMKDRIVAFRVLRLLADPLIGGGAGGSQARAGEGPQRRLAADPGRRDQPLSPAPVGWPDPFPRPDQGLLATDRAMASLAGGADAGGLG